MKWTHTFSSQSKHALQVYIHLAESAVAWVVLICASLMVLHLAYSIVEMLLHSMYSTSHVIIRPVIIEALDILILFEITQMFIRMEKDQKVTVRIMLETAVLFSVRESIINLYSGSHDLYGALTASVVFVLMRIAYSFKSQAVTHDEKDI